MEIMGVNFGSESKIDMIILKIFLKLKKSIKFVLTVLDTIKLKIAAYQGESFAFIRFVNNPLLFDSISTNNNTPPMPINDAHLGGFFIIQPYEKSLQ